MGELCIALFDRILINCRLRCIIWGYIGDINSCYSIDFRELCIALFEYMINSIWGLGRDIFQGVVGVLSYVKVGYQLREAEDEYRD